MTLRGMLPPRLLPHGPCRWSVSAVALAALGLFLLPAGGLAQASPDRKVARSSRGMVSAAQPLATRAGLSMLEMGGNAADAAVATAFAISVVEPSMNSIGGRTQILVRLPDGTFHGIDATTQAPDTYDPETAPQAGYGYPTIGVPGVVAGLTRLLREHGSLPLATVMAPAIEYAESGFELLPGEARRQAGTTERLKESEGARAYFLKPDLTTRRAGELFVQHDLARTLRTIARGGADAFYRGEIADRIVADMEAHGAALTRASLEDYRAVDALVVRGDYRGYELVGTHTPASGSTVIQILEILEHLPMGELDEADWAAAVGQALRMGFSERSSLRESDDLDVLLSEARTAELANDIRLSGTAEGAARPEEPFEYPWGDDQGHTTHMSAADADGMMVALTQTLGPAMGSKVVAPGLGFTYAATLGGYLGSLQPGERASSSIAPLMVLKDGEPVMVLGAAGGARIVSAVLQTVLRVIDQGRPLPDALAAARLHIRGDDFDMETSPGIAWSSETLAALRSMGFELRETPRIGAFGRVHAIYFDRETGEWVGAADPDWEGSAAGPADAGEHYELVIRNGRVLDGTGNPWFPADVAIQGDRVAAVGDLSGATADREIDAEGLFVSPGFIDSHSHAGPGLATEELSHGRPLLAEGVTTVLINPDGGGGVDLAAQRWALLEHGLGVNAAQLVPHGSVRRAVMGEEDRLAGEAELGRMRDLVRAGMEEGAFGLSSGTFYVPGSYSDNAEIIALGKVVAEYGGAYTSHIRDESNYTIGVVAAVEEVIDVARQAGIPGVLTHLKVLGPPVWGYSAAVVERIRRAREEGVSVYADQYPYLASATGLSAALLPRWAQAGGRDSLVARLNDPAILERVKEDMVSNLVRRGGADRIQFRRFREDPSIEGRLLSEVAAERELSPIDAAVEMFMLGGPSIVSFNMSEADVRSIMRQPWTMTSSDGGLVSWNVGVPHPRSYGAFPRKIRRYVIEEGVVGLPAAIRSMTTLPAQVFGMTDRGELREGAYADVVVFDLDRLRDRATYAEPHQLSEGMVHVFVNGVEAVRNGEFTDARGGRVLRHR